MVQSSALRVVPQDDVDPELHTVADVISFYLREAPASRSEQGQHNRPKEVRRLLGLFVQRHGARPVTACKPYHLQLWIDKEEGRVRSRPWSRWRKYQVNKIIQRPFNWARKLGLIDRNPFQGVTMPQGRQGRDMTDEEFRALTPGRFVLLPPRAGLPPRHWHAAL